MDESVAAHSRGNGASGQILAGVGLGALLGMIVGLSASPVVHAIVGALLTALAGFLHWHGSATAKRAAGQPDGSDRRIASFAFACLACVLLGLFIRSNDAFISLGSRVARWKAAGYPEEQALAYVAFQQLGIKPAGVEVVTGAIQQAHSSALFGASTGIKLCDELNPDRFADTSLRLKAFQALGNPKLTQLAQDIQNAPEAARDGMVRGVVMAICAVEGDKK
jgi:hypothetical protein